MINGIDSSWAQRALVPPSDAAFNITCASRANVGLRVDTDYAARVDNTRKAGKQVGHYFFNGNIDAATCGTFFVNNLHDYRAGDVLAVDCEDEGGTGTTAWTPAQVLAFGKILTSRLSIPAANILVYMNYDVNHRYNWQPVVDAGYRLWYARPDGNPTDQAHWPSWALRQYGIVGGLDRNETSLTTLATTGVVTPIQRKQAHMSTLYYTKDATGNLFALAGDGDGAAAWLETRDNTFANELGKVHGADGLAIFLTPASYASWKALYQTPPVAIDYDKLAAAIAKAIPAATVTEAPFPSKFSGTLS